MTNHIDQLTRWWYEAEKGIPKKGDLVISCNDDDGTFDVHTISVDQRTQERDLRILQRAPKPKPAWHNAVAVTATVIDYDGSEITTMWVRDGDELWRNDELGLVTSEDLLYVTPLIEAKVTDEMVDAARKEAKGRTGVYWEHSLVSRMLAAALGIEDE